MHFQKIITDLPTSLLMHVLFLSSRLGSSRMMESKWRFLKRSTRRIPFRLTWQYIKGGKPGNFHDLLFPFSWSTRYPRSSKFGVKTLIFQTNILFQHYPEYPRQRWGVRCEGGELFWSSRRRPEGGEWSRIMFRVQTTTSRYSSTITDNVRDPSGLSHSHIL